MRDEEDDRNPLRNVTLPGRLLVIFSILLVGSGFTFVLLGFAESDSLPAGRYPVILLLLPALIAGALFFILGRWVMRLSGVSFWRK